MPNSCSQGDGFPWLWRCSLVGTRFIQGSFGQPLRVWNRVISREPSPAANRHTSIKIGDVGFIHRGRFNLLFSAGSPLGTRKRGRDVPATFKPLNVGKIESGPVRPPGCLRTNGVLLTSADVAAASSPLYVKSLGPVSTTFNYTPFRPTGSGSGFSFELTGDRGAALITKYKTHRKDAVIYSRFEAYIKDHYESWVSFARKRKLGNDVCPVLVSGVDMTRDFTMVAYPNNNTSFEGGMTNNVQAFASASVSLPGTWYAKCAPHSNHGPQRRTCESNQCIFIRYYTMHSRERSTQSRGHSLGSGRGEGTLEWPVPAAAEGAAGYDEYLTEQGNLPGDNSASEQYVVVRNPSAV